MSQRQDFQNYNQNYSYDSYDLDMRKVGMLEKIVGTRMLERMKSPMFATVSLLAIGAAFAAVMVLSYPDAGGQGKDVPIVKAEGGSFKDQPDNPGGMEVANQDSTIFEAAPSAEMQETPPIENLLDQEKPVDKLQAFAKEADQLMNQKPGETASAQTAEAAKPSLLEAPAVEKPAAVAVDETPKQMPAKSVQPMMKADAASGPKAVPAVPIQPAGTAPQTMAFVRSVLDKKDGVSDSRTAQQPDKAAEKAAAIKPAAGATAGAAIKPGDYFIQLASISEESSAPSAWKNLQKNHSALQDISYRVKRADIPGRGVYYRIQAGPMSKDDANRLCAKINAQKTGGCLVVR